MIEIDEVGIFRLDDGRAFCSRGATRVRDRIHAYLVNGEARSWDGRVSLGRVRVISSWGITTPDGRLFKGRTLGERMAITARASR